MQVGSSAGSTSTSAAVYGSPYLNNIVTLSTSGVPAVASSGADRVSNGASGSRSTQASTSTESASPAQQEQEQQQQHMVDGSGNQDVQASSALDASPVQDPSQSGTRAPVSHPLMDGDEGGRDVTSSAQQHFAAGDNNPAPGSTEQRDQALEA
jgi:hypothetical protein